MKRHKKRKYRSLRERELWKTLKPYQRMMVRIRELPPVPWYFSVMCCVLFWVLFMVVARIDPKMEAMVYESDEDNTLVIDFVGDVMLGRNIKKLGEDSQYSNIFEYIAPYWGQSDLTFANLENAVLKDNISEYKFQNDTKGISLYSDYYSINAALDAGIDVFGCANNHSYDYGQKAVEELVEWFEENEVAYSGIGKNKQEVESWKRIEKDDMVIAFVSISDCYKEGSDNNIFTTINESQNYVVNESSKQADLTVVYMHWGEENEIGHNDRQEMIGHQLIDAGADIVIGSHPHVLQEIELYKDGIIFYSLGNFIFDQGNTYSKDSAMIRMRINESGNKEFKIFPIRIEDGRPCVVTNTYYKKRIYNELLSGLEENMYYNDENGYVCIELP